MTTVYVYVMDTMADWEIGYCLAELHSKRFFRKDASDISVKTVALSKETVKSMGGLTIVPDMTIKDVQVNEDNVLILPGSDVWSDSENFRILELAKQFLETGGLVAAICGATVALANIGLLDDKKHTSNGAGFLNMFCPDYKGTDKYIDEKINELSLLLPKLEGYSGVLHMENYKGEGGNFTLQKDETDSDSTIDFDVKAD